MGKPCCFLAVVLVSAVISLSFSLGSGRMIHVVRHYERWQSPQQQQQLLEAKSGIAREMIAMERDYKEPGANANTRNSALFNSSAHTPPPAH